MTSEQLLPRYKDVLKELKNINNSIDYDDDAAESLETLVDVANDTLIEMQGETT